MNEELIVKLKILKLYKKLFLKKLSAKDIENIYIEYLKLKVQLGDKVPCFKVKDDKYGYVNSFNYALDIDFPEYINEKYLKATSDIIRYKLGCLSGESFPYTNQSKLDNLIADLETLNIKWFETDIDQSNTHGGYKIAFYCDDLSDFYILRQNVDQSWSGKVSVFSEIMHLEKPIPIRDYYKLVKTLEIVKPIVR